MGDLDSVRRHKSGLRRWVQFRLSTRSSRAEEREESGIWISVVRVILPRVLVWTHLVSKPSGRYSKWPILGTCRPRSNFHLSFLSPSRGKSGELWGVGVGWHYLRNRPSAPTIAQEIWMSRVISLFVLIDFWQSWILQPTGWPTNGLHEFKTRSITLLNQG
jgi:hypothetical protein